MQPWLGKSSVNQSIETAHPKSLRKLCKGRPYQSRLRRAKAHCASATDLSTWYRWKNMSHETLSHFLLSSGPMPEPTQLAHVAAISVCLAFRARPSASLCCDAAVACSVPAQFLQN